MNLRKLSFAVALLAGLGSQAIAAYTISRTDGGNNTLLVQGRAYTFLIKNIDTPVRLQDVRVQFNPPSPAPLLQVGIGVQTGPDTYALDQNGELYMSITFNAPTAHSITVTNTADPNNFSVLSGIQVQSYPITYQVNPSNPVVTANQPFQVNITAINGSNVVVTAYEDPVQIVDSQTGNITFVPGSAFVNGIASNVSVTVQAARLNNQFDLTFTLAGNQYYDPLAVPSPPHLVARAQKILQNLTLIPGPFNKYVMLFPGETLTPGTGKSGAVTPQQSGVDVSLVRTYRVDQFFNPILTNPPSPNLRFTSNRAQDTVFPVNVTMNSAILDIVSGGTPYIEFNGAGTVLVRVEDLAMGGSLEEDVSQVPVDPGSAEFYTISLSNGANSITTDDVVQATIQAFVNINGTPTLLTSLNGTVQGAELKADFGPVVGASTMWVDTNTNDLIPQNVVSFNNGVALVNLNVTKAGLGAVVTYQTPSALAAVSNPPFNVNVGAPNKIHFTIVGKHPNPTQGEVYTPGTYPGNSGTPPVLTAGEEVVLEARVTDKRWNVAPGTLSTLQLGNNIQMNHYYEARHINPGNHPGPIYTFPVGGEFRYQNSNFDNSFRMKMRTSGPSSLVLVGPTIRGVTNLSGGTSTCPSPTTNAEFCASSMTVTPDVYAKMVIAAPGEILRPGIPSTTESDGKIGSAVNQQAGVNFNGTGYATDQYFNPVINGPFPAINFDITPNLAGSFIGEALPISMVSGIRTVPIILQTSSDVKIRDNNDQSKNQTVSIPIAAGPLHHFAITTISSPQNAGSPFTVTITGQDQYNNTITVPSLNVDLTPNTGATTMSPSQVTLTNGVFTGNLTMFASSPTVNITMSTNGQPNATRVSNNFTVLPALSGYQKLLLLLPGETILQGTAVGKTGSPTPITVGQTIISRAIACDTYYNPLLTTGIVEFSSNRYATFGPAQGSLVNVNGYSEFSTPLTLRTAAIHTISLRDVNSSGITTSTSVIQGNVGTYKKLQLVAPGETTDPGTNVPSGKTGTPLQQTVAVPFNVTINAVDDFWNLVPFNGGDIRMAADISAVLFNPPNNNGGPSPRVFVNGAATREVILGQQGLATLSVIDDANLTKPGQAVQIDVQPGPNYVFQTAATAVAGQPFPAVTITLEENGVPLNGYNESIFLTADLASGGPGSGSFNPNGTPREYVMNNGSVVINDLTYAYSERIRIRLQDNFGRVAFSNDIEVVPSGLKYVVSVPPSATAGGPSTFNVQVQLLEENTNTLVRNHDHEVSVQVISAANPTTDGQYSVTSAQFNQGLATFDQTYTKAESIIIRIEESPTAGEPNYVVQPRNSNNINVSADGYKKLLLIAPGETHVPGVPSNTGKTGTPTNRQKGVSFLVQVRGVDQYWNVASSFNGGQVFFTSNDLPPSLNASNPANQNAPLVNGESASSINLLNPGNVEVTIRDNSDSGIGTQSVILQVGGNYYAITVPAQEFSGPPTTFSMSATLYDSNTNQPILTANYPVTIQALLPNGSTATGNLGVTSANLTNGTLSILSQSYSIAEDVLLRVSDANGDTGNSSVIHFIPRQIRYTIETPTEAEVNTPFPVVIKTIDADTGTEVKNLNRTNDLSAMSNQTGLPVAGNFSPNSVNIINGVGNVSAFYDRAESIFLVMTDNTPPFGQSAPTQPDFNSTPIVINPGALASVEIADFTMQSNVVIAFNVICRDTYGNLIPAQPLQLSVISNNLPGEMKMNGQVNSLTSTANGQGELAVTFEPSLFANGVYQILLSDPNEPNGFSRVLNVTVLGFPIQPSGALGLGENRIPVNSTVFLEINTQVPSGGRLRTFYRVNNSAWFTYDPSVGIMANDPSRSVPFFDTTREWLVEWYSEVCYNLACSNPISELSVNGAPHIQQISTYQLDDNLVGYPNPFNPKGPADENYITLQYPLAQASSVEIDIYDLFGQQVWHKDINAGDQGGEARVDNRVFWFGTNDDGITVANGGYIVVVKVGATGQRMRSKILVAK